MQRWAVKGSTGNVLLFAEQDEPCDDSLVIPKTTNKILSTKSVDRDFRSFLKSIDSNLP